MDQQRLQLTEAISSLVHEEKQIESDVIVKCKALSMAKKKLKEARRDKNKIDTPVLVDLENILAARNISAAAYHGKLLFILEWSLFKVTFTLLLK